MDYFIDIKIKPDSEMRENVLLNKVYTKLHKILFTLKTTEIGISFPRTKVMLGDVIRIHGTEIKLTELQTTKWLGGLIGYCDISEVIEIPEKVKYRTVSRIQMNMSPAKLRRLVKRGTIQTDEMKRYKAKMFDSGIDNPFLELESSSNGNKHRRYIKFGQLLDKPVAGNFDDFGLSKAATVPWF